MRTSLLCACLLLLASHVHATPPTDADAVIPAGQDELLAEMLGRGVTLPGGCAVLVSGGRVGLAVLVCRINVKLGLRIAVRVRWQAGLLG